MPRMSVATIDQPEFINLQPLDINPLMSKCEIKVFYVGENRNHSFISKEVATEMAKTLRGAPIVGYYKGDKEDFRDHGEKITIDSDGIQFESQTKPYGFVAPDAKVWFQTFTDTDDFGNEVEHEYLMTTGYLWTGQYEEAKLPVEEGRPHSMELDNESLDGHWAKNSKSGVDFFIINDAIVSKLCILGEDIEPCFEGSDITAPNISASFTLDSNFTKSLYNMMQELKFALEGGQSMDTDNKITPEDQVSEDFSAQQDKTDETVTNKIENPTEGESQDGSSYAKSDDDNKDEKDKNDDSSDEDKKDDDEDKEDKYSLLQQQYEELQGKFTALEADYQTLVSFKNDVETEKKDAMIKSFYMLSDEDKKDVIENKSKYTLDEIEAKLSIIYTKKQLAAETLPTENDNSKNTVVYTLEDQDAGIPDWVKAVRDVQETL